MAPKAVRYEIGLPPTRVGGTTGFVGDWWRDERLRPTTTH